MFIGDVGFQRDDFDYENEQVLVQKLINKRWPKMHTELIPFAHDGAGNRFCFIFPHDELNTGRRPIAYWMYETYRAVPIASSFSHFLHWVAMRTLETVERGVDPHIDREHLQSIVIPLMDELGLAHDFDESMRTVRTPLVTAHQGMLQVDPGSPGALLLEASRELRRGHWSRAEDYGNRAIMNFHRFAAAHVFLAELENHHAGSRKQRKHLLETLTSPLCYAGDPRMPGLHDLPNIELNRVVHQLIQYKGNDSFQGYEPIRDLIDIDNPEDATAWMRSSLDYAERGDLDRAMALASNALFLAWSPTITSDVLLLLEELYALRRSTLHLDIILADRRHSASSDGQTIAPSL